MGHITKIFLLLFMIVGTAFSPIQSFAVEGGPIIFSGSSNSQLAKDVADHLGIKLGEANIGKFNDGEINIQVQQNVRNQDVFVLQSTCSTEMDSVNDNVMELYLLIRTLKRASAKSVNVVIPYFGYARQDRKTTPRVPISASDVAMLLENGGADRVLAVDLHCGQIQGFFHHAPVDNLYASAALVPYFSKVDLRNAVVVSPDAGGVERAKKFRELLGRQGIEGEIAMIIKQRSGAGSVSEMNLVGDVNNADVIIVDDMCDTAGTLVKAAQLLKDQGARRVFAAITHSVFSGPALERIEKSVITELVTTDTIPLRGVTPLNITQISVAPLLGEAINRIHEGESVSNLFL